MRRGWFSACTAGAIALALSGISLHAQFVYVANDIIGPGSVSGYTIDPTTGAFTAVAGSPFEAGVEPTAVAVDLKGKFAFVVNKDPNESISAYSIGPSGVLTPVPGSPFPGEFGSRAVAVDPSSKFVYVANSVVGDTHPGSISGYTIDPSTGALTVIAGSPFAAGVGANSVAVDPSGKFAYVANAGYNAVAGYTINPTTGALAPIAGIFPFGPSFPAGAGPILVAVDPSGKFAYVANGTATTFRGTRSTRSPGRSRPSPVRLSPPGQIHSRWRWTRAASSPTWRISSAIPFRGTRSTRVTGALTAIAGSPFVAGS